MRFKLIVISVITLIAAYSLFWFKLADDAKEMTLAWVENSEDRLNGVKLFVGDVTVSGFPYKIVIEATTFNAAIPEGYMTAEPILITIPEISAVYQPWKPNHAVIVTDYMDAVIGELSMPSVSINFEKVMSSVILDEGTNELNNFSIIADLTSWQHGLPGEGNKVSFMGQPEFHLRRNTGGNISQSAYDLPVSRALYFKSGTSLINGFRNTVLGENADQIKIETLLHANSQPDYTIAGLSEWRDDGGTLSISNFEYGSVEQKVKLTGDLTLDENLKPLGAFDASVTNIASLFLRLSENDNIPEMARSLLKNQASASSLPEEVPLAISMQNGQMYVGPIMVMELPPVIE